MSKTTTTPASGRPPQRRAAVGMAVFAAAGALASLVGVSFGLEPLVGGIPGLRAVHPNTAAALLTLALAMLAAERNGRLGRWGVWATTLGAATVGAAALSAHLGGPGDALGSLLVKGGHVGGDIPRMPLQAAVSAVLLGGALLVAAFRSHWRRTLLVLTGVPAAIAASVLIGYLYGAGTFYQPFGSIATAPFAALAIHALAAGIYLRALPVQTWQTLTAATPTAVLLRRVLPISLFALVAIGYLTLSARRAGWLSSEAETAMTVVLSGVVLIVLLVHTGFQLNRYVLQAERARQQAEAATKLLHRQSLELNDDVVQKLSTAWLAHETGDPELAHDSVRQATQQAQRIAAELLQARADTDPVMPGGLVRLDPTAGDDPTDPG